MPWWAELAGGLGVVGVTITGMVYGAGRLLTEATTHDVRSCGCGPCTTRRQEATWRTTRTVLPYEKPSPDVIQAHWMSTRELRPGMSVLLTYRVHDVTNIRFDAGGWVVELRNRNTCRLFLVPVPLALCNRKMWEPVR